MTAMENEIRGLLTDVDNFLKSPGLKESALSKSAIVEKKRILEDIEQLRKKYPQLTFGSNDLYEDTETEPPTSPAPILYEDTDAPKPERTGKRPPPSPIEKTPPPEDIIRPVGVTDVFNSDFAGHLKKKDKKKIAFGTKKVYCVLSDGVFYYFEKNTSKRQLGAFCIKGYEARTCPSNNKKEFAFDLVKPAGVTYSFVATTADERDKWIQIFNNKSLGAPVVTGKPASPEVTYEDTQIEEQMYEETEASPPETRRKVPEEIVTEPIKKTTPAEKPKSPAPVAAVRALPQDQDEYYDDTAVNESQVSNGFVEDEFYDEAVSTASSQPQPPAVPVPTKKEADVPQTAVPRRLRPESVASSSYAGYNRPALPPRTTNTIDYSMMYYGMWDWTSDKDDELSFKRGDILEIINTDHESHGWWIGRLNHDIGLVPKTYLTCAYELTK